MQPIIAAMIKVRKAFYAALLRSFLRTKSILQTILNIWISPSRITGENGSAAQSNGECVESGSLRKERVGSLEFLEIVDREMRGGVNEKNLLKLSDGLKKQLEESLVDNPQCMLPSYNDQLPTGDERGTYLALDVGGSTFRVALVELLGGQKEEANRIGTIRSFKINQPVKALKGRLFFDWMASRIEETLSGKVEGHGSGAPLSMGLAWSFPIE